MMRHGRGADLLLGDEAAAGERAFDRADLLEDLVAARLGERAGDALELALGEAGHREQHNAPVWPRTRISIVQNRFKLC